jgi:hypothetical protein
LKHLYKLLLFALTLTVLVACSRKKDSFVNRNYHAVTGEFNTLYNGEVAFDKGKASLAGTFNDNYWKVLPIERMESKDEVILPGDSKDPNFNRAEEKSVKMIQKHGMYIDGQEHNPQVDEAYILLGKTRYFDQRFVPALDAFNFILDRYPTSNNINKAKVWKAKTNIRLNNEEIAIGNLKKMLENDEIDDEDIAEASASIAEAYLRMDSIPEALPFVKEASALVKNKELKGRYLYIKGQLYNELGEKDSANIAFDEVIALNRKTSRDYMINAYLAKARNFDYDKEDKVVFLELLTELEENRENRPYLDKIYNQKGNYYLQTANVDTAVIFYNKSIRNVTKDKTLQSINYRTLAEINFDEALYKNAGAYYDSTLLNLDDKSRLFRRIKKKRENLDDVIKYEDIATINDSVLRVAGMSDDDKLSYFTEYTAKLKDQAIADSIAFAKEKSKKGIKDNEFFKKKKTDDKTSSGPFYFYNSSTAAYGKQEFRKTWGDRELADYWRISSQRKSGIEDKEVTTEDIASIADDVRFDPETYIAQIPTDQKVLDSLSSDRNFAYYQLGLIYKEKFKEYNLAANRLEKLLTLQPEERLVLPAKYNLYKIYGILENGSLEQQYKTDILNKHSDSRYAEILRNPSTQLATDESSPEFKYNALYKKFEAQRYQDVIDTADEYITTYNGDEIVPKLELLKATALGKQEGYDAYKKALNYVSLNYPNDDEGKQAQLIYSNTLPKLAFNSFMPYDEGKSFKIVYSFSKAEREQAESLKTLLDEIIVKANYANMITSIDYYNPDIDFVVVHGLKSRLGSQGFGEILYEGNMKTKNKKFKITRTFFDISTENYKTIQIHKNLDIYLNPPIQAAKEIKEKKVDNKKD